jgi:hypothetical protein
LSILNLALAVDSKPISPAYPGLVGQHADYLDVVLKSYQTNNAQVGRANGVMGALPASTPIKNSNSWPMTSHPCRVTCV